MGTRYSAAFFTEPDRPMVELHQALQQSVDAVDAQMSTWKPGSDLMQLNRAPVGIWIDVPEELATVLAAALEVGRASGGAFDIGVGDLVSAWGFGPGAGAPDPDAAAAAGVVRRVPAHLAIELDLVARRVRKHRPVTLDLSGIAKGYGVDELARVLESHGIRRYLVSIDGELRAGAPKPDGSSWRVALERPEFGYRAAAGVIEIADAALATSGDYRHVVEFRGARYGHTIDPRHHAPLRNGPASVTVRAASAMQADAWATALMVLGPERGGELASALDLEVLFAEHGTDPTDLHQATTPAPERRSYYDQDYR
ncbi:MAG TPA: FAD:protein FMN transferase [Devosia sp.]|jgi:thiamine biosynthesis lipoprotein|uniref:FAD:protein FMN transferase n=1 Tax=Devosia sp. TaxID=1871048 RepID=UPI002DDDB8F6|nr:FAD:protein FMN transferase [Devosia sp.]HEV2516141.1 FAD:protein FMN transferase [Devosia sp.]